MKNKVGMLQACQAKGSSLLISLPPECKGKKTNSRGSIGKSSALRCFIHPSFQEPCSPWITFYICDGICLQICLRFPSGPLRLNSSEHDAPKRKAEIQRDQVTNSYFPEMFINFCKVKLLKTSVKVWKFYAEENYQNNSKHFWCFCTPCIRLKNALIVLLFK